MADKGEWRCVASRSDIKRDAVHATQFSGDLIALTEIEGRIYAFSDTCTHEFALLSEGFLEGTEIECPLHQARFDVCSGRCLEGPATQDLETYEVKIEGDEVYVRRGAQKSE
jgi:nitrite reductase/ring-hydroxylating ferredoxin subunit